MTGRYNDITIHYYQTHYHVLWLISCSVSFVNAVYLPTRIQKWQVYELSAFISEVTFCWWFMHLSLCTNLTCLELSLWHVLKLKPITILLSFFQCPWRSFKILPGTSTTVNSSCMLVIKQIQREDKVVHVNLWPTPTSLLMRLLVSCVSCYLANLSHVYAHIVSVGSHIAKFVNLYVEIFMFPRSVLLGNNSPFGQYSWFIQLNVHMDGLSIL